MNDSIHRMSLFSTSSTGVRGGTSNSVTGRKLAFLEVFLDRILQQDDNRGLFEPLVDNKIVSKSYRLLLEGWKVIVGISRASGHRHAAARQTDNCRGHGRPDRVGPAAPERPQSPGAPNARDGEFHEQDRHELRRAEEPDDRFRIAVRLSAGESADERCRGYLLIGAVLLVTCTHTHTHDNRVADIGDPPAEARLPCQLRCRGLLQAVEEEIGNERVCVSVGSSIVPCFVQPLSKSMFDDLTIRSVHGARLTGGTSGQEGVVPEDVHIGLMELETFSVDFDA